MNKKILALALTAAMAASFALAGCGSDDSASTETETETKTETAAAETTEASAAGYVFKSGDVEIAVDADADEIVEALGEPSSQYDEPSCASDGTAYFYTYPGFEMETYPDGDKNLVYYVVLKDDTVATPEGIDLSMTKDDILEAYGDPTEETDTALTYKDESGAALVFIMDGDDIASIEYDSACYQ